jgi:hypothetical protein
MNCGVKRRVVGLDEVPKTGGTSTTTAGELTHCVFNTRACKGY